MRLASRLLANVKPARFLEAGNPTGLTGLPTHAAPRSTLLYLYSATLDKLKAIPDHSVYRQSVERIIQHRMGIVDAIKPQGYDDWAERAKKMVQEHPEIFDSKTPGPHSLSQHGGQTFVTTQQKAEQDERLEEWDGEEVTAGTLEGPRFAEERASQKFIAQKDYLIDQKAVQWEPEPQLEASQIEELENKIGGGLIEEVIQVAEGELKLVDTMIESNVWEELEENAPDGQWEYFTLDRHMPITQEPPK